MSPKQDQESPEARRAKLKGRLVDDCKQMAKFREEHWPDDGRTWAPLRMLDCMIETFQENHRDDDKSGWERWLDVAFEYRREIVV